MSTRSQVRFHPWAPPFGKCEGSCKPPAMRRLSLATADDGADGPKSDTRGVSSRHSTENNCTGSQQYSCSHHEASWYSTGSTYPGAATLVSPTSNTDHSLPSHESHASTYPRQRPRIPGGPSDLIEATYDTGASANSTLLLFQVTHRAIVRSAVWGGTAHPPDGKNAPREAAPQISHAELVR